MSLLKTTQSSDNGVMRLTSYHRSRREGSQSPARTRGRVPVDASTSSQHAASTMTPLSIYTTSTENELHKIIARNASLGGESRDPTEESIPTAMSQSNASSFSVSKAYANYSLSPQRQRYSTPPPQRVTSPKQLTSPAKSFDSGRSGHKIAVNDPSSMYSMSIGKVQVQNSPPLSPNHRSLTPTRRQQRSPILGTYGSFNDVDTNGNVVVTDQKSEAYERASNLLQRADASKVAAKKVEKAREAARLAMEKARMAKAAKLQEQGSNKTLRFADEVESNDITRKDPPASIGIPRNSKSKPKAVEEYAYSLQFDEDDDLSSMVKDRYGVADESTSRYEVANAEEDALDDVIELQARRGRGRFKGTLPPLSPPRAGDRDELEDMMDFAEAMLLGGTESQQEANEIVADACSFADQLGCGSGEQAMPTSKPLSPTKRYPMGPTPAVLERVLEDEDMPPPPSPPPEVMDSVAFRVQQNAKSKDKYDQTDSELDDIMTFAAGLLGSKSGEGVPSSEATDVKRKKGKSKSPTKKRQKASANVPDNLGEGDELDQIMDFAASLLGSKQPEATSIVEPVQVSQAVPNKKSSSNKDKGCMASACSVWHDDFFRTPEEEVVFVGAKKETNDSPTLLQAAKSKHAPVPPPPEAFSLKPVPSLADDLTDKTSPSWDIPGVTAKPSQEALLYSDILQVTTVEEDSDAGSDHFQQGTKEDGALEIGNEAIIASHVRSTSGTILDSNDEYWDTLSSIPSNSKEFSVNRVSHPHQHAEHAIPQGTPGALTTLDERAPFGAILCGWLGMEQQNGGLRRPDGTKAGDTYGETNGSTFIATEASKVPEIPKMIQYEAMPSEQDETNDQMQTETLNRVETLITKGSSGSSSSSESFYQQDRINSFKTDGEQTIEHAVDHGQTMASPASPASPVSPSSSRYGHDNGDDPMVSPTHPSHDSKSSQVTPSSRKVTDRRKPWNKGQDKGSPTNRFQPINDDEELNRQLEAEDSGLAAMLGINKVASRKDDAKNDLPLDALVGSHSQDSGHSDLLMVLTRSAGDEEDEEALMSPSTVGISNLSSPKKSSDVDSALSPASGEIDNILTSLKRAETMGHDDQSVEMVSSPRSQTRKGAKSKSKRPSATKQPEDDRVQQQGRANEKLQHGAAIPKSPKREQKHQVAETTISPRRERMQQAATSPTSPKREAKPQAPTAPKSPKKEAIASPPRSPPTKDSNDTSNSITEPELSWAEQNAAANAAAAAAAKTATSQPSTQDGAFPSMLGVLFDDLMPAPTGGVEQLEKAQRQREKEGLEKKQKAAAKQKQKQEKGSNLAPVETSCPPMFSVFMDDDAASPPKSENNGRPHEYVSPNQSDDEEEMDNIQVVQAPTDIAVRLSPVKDLRVTQEGAQVEAGISSVSSKDSKTKIMSELLSKYDNIIDHLIHDKPRNNETAKTENSAEVEVVLSKLREQREYAMKLPSRAGERHDSRESSSPPRSKSPRRKPISPTKSRRDQEYLSSTVGRSSSPTKSPVRYPLQTESTSRLHASRIASSPTPSPRRSSTSPVRSSYRTSRSPTRSPRRQSSAIQSRDVATPTRSASGRYDRTSAPRSPRRSKSSGRAPRPEDKIEEMRRRREASLSPPKTRRSTFSSNRREPESREARDTLRAVKRVYSPERTRHRIIYDDGDNDFEYGSRSRSEDESEYGAISREIQKELRMAKRASDDIRDVNDELFDELGVFQDKLLRHSKRKDSEREFISESRNAMNDFQHRLERVRKYAHNTRRSGRETPETLEQVEHALEDAYGDFDTVRGTMLTNLNMLSEAKEQLMRERKMRQEDTDDEQLLMLENMIQDIRQSQQHKAEVAIDDIRDSNSRYGHNRTSRFKRREYGRREQPTYTRSTATLGRYASRDWSAPKERPSYTTARTTPSSRSAPRPRLSHVYSSPRETSKYEYVSPVRNRTPATTGRYEVAQVAYVSPNRTKRSPTTRSPTTRYTSRYSSHR